jgi:hypothetical protein
MTKGHGVTEKHAPLQTKKNPELKVFTPRPTGGSPEVLRETIEPTVEDFGVIDKDIIFHKKT